MAEEPSPPPEVPDEEEGGGPVKPFLDHLEDLRWTLIKVISVVIVSMIICLVAGDKLVEILTYPLYKADRLRNPGTRTVTIHLGETASWKIPLASLDSNLWAGVSLPSSLRLSLVPDGTNVAFFLRADTNATLLDAAGDMPRLKNYSPLSAFQVALELALSGGLALSSPFVLFFIGQFVLPALKVREKYFLYRALAVGLGLFLVGVVFAYFAIMQVTLLATVQFSQWLGFSADEWRAEDYIDFVVKMILAVGLSFQLPVVLLTLVKVGILSYKMLSKGRSYFVVINLVVCAFITPSGDPVTLLLLAVPVQLLYEASVLVAWIWWRRDQRELAAAEAAAGLPDQPAG